MSRDMLLPLSILALAAAVALHAVAPAVAQEPPPMIPPGRLAPDCVPYTLGTPKELEKVLGKLHEAGHEDFLVIGSTICGWR